jgi:hypothetical protein
VDVALRRGQAVDRRGRRRALDQHLRRTETAPPGLARCGPGIRTQFGSSKRLTELAGSQKNGANVKWWLTRACRRFGPTALIA